MSLNDILEELPNLTDDEKRQLRDAIDGHLAAKDEESPETLAAIDEGIRSLESGEKTYTVDEVREHIDKVITRTSRSRR